MNSLRLRGAGPRWPWAAASVAVMGCAVPAAGQVFLNERQALEVIFGQDVTAGRQVKSLTEPERKRLEGASGLRFSEPSFTFFAVEKHDQLAGYALVLDEIGKSEPITFMVGMSPEGKVIDTAVMVFRESRGWEVKEKRFLRQFRNKRAEDAIQIDRDIINYAGATLSSKALARGVKRALLLLQEFYPPEQRRPRAAAESLVCPMPLAAMEVKDAEAGRVSLYRQARYRMGTICEIRLWAASSAEAVHAFEAGFGEIERLDQVFSNYRGDSELARVNEAAAEASVQVSAEFWKLSRYALSWWKRSQGTFDVTVAPLLKLWGFWQGTPRVPSAEEVSQVKGLVGAHNVQFFSRQRAIRFRKRGTELDFGGLAKGYAADRAARLAHRAGAVSALVNLGGSSLCAAGYDGCSERKEARQAARPSDSSSALHIGEWVVGISHAAPRSEWVRFLTLRSGWSLSTSASSEQSLSAPSGQVLCHIIDPRTGAPTAGPCSATVLARSGLLGEVLAKPLLLLNPSGRKDILQRDKRFEWALVQRPQDSAMDQDGETLVGV